MFPREQHVGSMFRHLSSCSHFHNPNKLKAYNTRVKPIYILIGYISRDQKIYNIVLEMFYKVSPWF